MGVLHATKRHSSGTPSAPRRAVGLLTTKSLIFYLLAVAAQKLWMVLNSDVTELFQRPL